jgi:hypothetical protein
MVYRTLTWDELKRLAITGDAKAMREILVRVLDTPEEWIVRKASDYDIYGRRI